MSAVQDVLSRVLISEVYAGLTDVTPRRAAGNRWRARATWRGGDGWSVSLDDSCSGWKDFATGDGGGVLDLVVRVRGGTRADALRWVADFAGIPLDDRPLSREDRKRWAAERRRSERDLPKARYWRRAAVLDTEAALNLAKSQFFDSSAQERPPSAELHTLTRDLARLEQLQGAALVAEYYRHCEYDPHTAARMVEWVRMRETAERRALVRYLAQLEAGSGIQY